MRWFSRFQLPNSMSVAYPKTSSLIEHVVETISGTSVDQTAQVDEVLEQFLVLCVGQLVGLDNRVSALEESKG